MIGEGVGLEPPLLPVILAIALLVERQKDHGAVFIFPFTGENMAVTRLRADRWRRKIRGISPMNRRPSASGCE
jgi:predicted kinase